MAKIDNSLLFILKTKNLFSNILKIFKGTKEKILQSQIDNINDEIANMQKLFNVCTDITNFPKATGDLRKLQLADTKCLEMFDLLCKNLGLTYWADFGTLLGAIRHKGFIPWDDDIDIGMPREDYEKIRTTYYKEFEKYGFIKNEGKSFGYPVIRLIFKNSAIQVDLWPYDLYYKRITTQEEKSILVRKVIYCNKSFYNTVSQTSMSKGSIKFPVEKLKQMREKLVLENNKPSEDAAYFSGCEALTYGKPQIINAEDLLPTKACQFENLIIQIPNNYDKYLKNIYKDYMAFPTEKINHLDITNRIFNVGKYLLETEKANEKLKDDLKILN